MSRIKLKKQLEQSATPGSLPVTDASNELNYTAPGTNGQVLTVTAGIPTWENVAVNDAFNGTSVNGTSVQLGDDVDGVTPGQFVNDRYLNTDEKKLFITQNPNVIIGSPTAATGSFPYIGDSTRLAVINNETSHEGDFVSMYQFLQNTGPTLAGVPVVTSNIYLDHGGVDTGTEVYPILAGAYVYGPSMSHVHRNYFYIDVDGPAKNTNIINPVYAFSRFYSGSNVNIIDNYSGFESKLFLDGSGTINNLYGLNLFVQKLGTYTINEVVGINIQDYPAAISTNLYSLKSVDNDAKMYHQGEIHIGTNSGTDKLDVNGTARIRTSKGTQATTITGRDINGAITEIGLGTGFSLSAGTLNYNCPAPMTYAALQALVTSNSLIPGCTYTINDFVQGNLAAGTTVTLTAIDNNTLSMQAHVFTAYDDQAWFGIYDFGLNALIELWDNLGNKVSGTTGIEVSNFDWGNPNLTNVLIDNSTFNYTAGSPLIVDKVEITNNATVDCVNATGFFTQSKINSSFFECANTAVNIEYLNIDGFSNFSIGDISNIVEIHWLTVEQQSNIYFQASAFTLSFDKVLINNTDFNFDNITSATIITFSDSYFYNNLIEIDETVYSGANTIEISSSTLDTTEFAILNGNIALSNARILRSSLTYNSFNGSFLIEDSYLSECLISDESQATDLEFVTCNFIELNFTAVNGSISNSYFQNVFVSHMDISVDALSTGVLSLYSCNLSHSSISKNNTNLLFLENVTMLSAASIEIAGERELSISVTVIKEGGYIIANGLGVGPDNLNTTCISGRSGINFNLTSGVSLIQQSSLSEDSTLTLQNDALSIRLSNINLDSNSGMTLDNCINIDRDIEFVKISTEGRLDITNINNPTTTHSDFVISNFSFVNISNTTGSGDIKGINTTNKSVFNIDSSISDNLGIQDVNILSGNVNIKGGSVNKLVKSNSGLLDNAGFNITDVIHMSSALKVMTANNTNTGDYIGVVSVNPII